MIRFNIVITWEKSKWLAKLFRCKHVVVSVEENFQSRYGTRTAYIMCLKCGRTAMEISKNCKHKVESFGTCIYCLDMITKNDCLHKSWNQEPDTNDYYCTNCGVWKDELRY